MRISRALALFGVSLLAITAAVWIWRAAPRHPRMLLIGVDGADPGILDRLIRRGHDKRYRDSHDDSRGGDGDRR